VEIWRLINTTEDAHPIHMHLVQFQILDRQPFDTSQYPLTQLVAQIEFVEWTPDGHLRHAKFIGLRDDKDPRKVERENPTNPFL